MKKWMLAVAALLVLSLVGYGCDPLSCGKWELTITVDGQGTTDPNGVKHYDDDLVSVLAEPAAFWRFDGWGGDASGAENPLVFVINGDTNLVAKFSPNYQMDPLVDGTIAMARGEGYAYAIQFSVCAATMREVRVSGNLAVVDSGGSRGDPEVRVFLLDEPNYSSFKAGLMSYTALYSSGQFAYGTPGTLDVPITTAGETATPFYLAFVASGPVGWVHVEAHIELKYVHS